MADIKQKLENEVGKAMAEARKKAIAATPVTTSLRERNVPGSMASAAEGFRKLGIVMRAVAYDFSKFVWEMKQTLIDRRCRLVKKQFGKDAMDSRTRSDPRNKIGEQCLPFYERFATEGLNPSTPFEVDMAAEMTNPVASGKFDPRNHVGHKVIMYIMGC